jgi:uncharacterized protein YceK
MKELVVCMIVAVFSGCATVQAPSPAATQSQPATYDRWDAVQQSVEKAAEAAALAGEDSTKVYSESMALASNTVLQDADPNDWAWKGEGPRPSAQILQQDRYRCLQVSKKMIAATGADNTIFILASGFVGGMEGAGWEWR